MNSTKAKASPAGAVTADTRRRTNIPLALCRSTLATLATLYCYSAYVLRRLTLRDRQARLDNAVCWVRRWFAMLLRATGIRLSHSGAVPQGGSFIAPNHLGYADILALGSFVNCFFVAKSDVESWPVVGHLFKIAEQIGVSRQRRRGVIEANEKVVERLRAGHSVCVFLEGTSSGGGNVLPFHASLLQPAIDAQAPVTPVAIRWTATDPRVDIAEDVAYWKDHTFASHLWRLLGLRGIEVHVEFCEPIATEGHDRKALAAQVRETVVQSLER